MRTYYMVNGFEEGLGYFYNLGRFTKEEREKLDNGEVVEKNDNRFWITTDEMGRPEPKEV